MRRPSSLPRRGLAAAILVLLLAPGLALAGDTASPAVKRVEAKKVCMVNNHVFERDQIPVKVEDRTYYGCCEMCKERLAKDAAIRSAVDPVSGKPVDKAKAVIAAQEDGTVLYFESEASLAKYQSQGAKGSGR
jgi:YHS domain-containing protein